MENVIEETKTERKEFNLKEVFVLWKHKDETGTMYLSGYESKETGPYTLTGRYNTEKKNEKEPDIRVYVEDAKDYASLWINTSKDGNMYLSGTLKDGTRLVGFYTKELINNRPDIRVYYSEV